MKPPATWMTINEAAAWLGVHRSTVYRMINGGEIEIAHIRRHVRISPEALERYVRQQTIPPSNDSGRVGTRPLVEVGARNARRASP